MERVNNFWEGSVAKPSWEEQLGGFGVSALVTLVAAQHLSSAGVAAFAAVSGTAIAALDARDSDENEGSPFAPAAIGMISAAAVISLVNVAKMLNDEVVWTMEGAIDGIALPVSTLGLAIDVLWNGFEGNSSQSGPENQWPNACRDAALFAIPAGFNFLLAHMQVHPVLTTAIWPSIVGILCWVNVQYDKRRYDKDGKVHYDREVEWRYKPLVVGALAGSLLLSGVLMAQRSTLETWKWTDRGAMTFLGSATAVNAIATIYFISKKD